MIEMTEHIPGNSLERGADENFTVIIDDIGKITSIKLSKDRSDDWECEFIEVTRDPDSSSGVKSKFNVNTLLAHGDGEKTFSAEF